MGVALLSALATTASTAIGTGFASFAAGAKFFLAQAALGAVANALTPKQNNRSQGLTVTSHGADLDHQIVYGRARVWGAVVGDWLTAGLSGDTGNRFLHRLLALTGHEIDGFERVYIDSEAVIEWKTEDGTTTGITDVSPYVGSDIALVPTKVASLDGNGDVIAGSEKDKFGAYNFIAIRFFSGAPDQTYSAALQGEFTDPNVWDSNRRLRGLSYLYVRFGYSAEVFPTGLPEISTVIRGRKVFDPRDSQTRWSNNAALCLRDYLTAPHGLEDDAARIDDVFVTTAANIADQTNTLSGAPRYTCNGAFLTSQRPLDVIGDLLTSMGGLVFYAQGKWRMKAAAWSAPVLDLDEGDLRSAVSITTRHSRRDNFNRVSGSFTGLETSYAKTGYAPVESAAYLSQDGGQSSTTELDLPFTDTSDEGRRIARIVLERNRQQLTVSATWAIKAMRAQIGDVVSLTHARFGWFAKTFEVTHWALVLSEQKTIEVNLTLREISAEVFDEIDDGAALEGDNTALPNLPYQLTVTGLAISSTAIVAVSGEVFSRAVVSWDATASQILSHYVVEWKTTGATNWQSTTTQNNAIEIGPLDAGQNYDLRVFAVTSGGISGSYVTGAFIAAQDATPPPVPTATGKTNTVRGRQVTVRWSNPATDAGGDPVYDLRGTEIWRGAASSLVLDGNGDPTNAVQLDRVSGEEYIDTSGDWDTTYFYFVRAIDWSGNKSDFDAGRSIDTQPEPNSEGIAGDLSAPALLIPSDADGSNPVFTDATSIMTIYNGGIDDSANWAFSISQLGSGVSASISGATVTITGLTLDGGFVEILAARSGYNSVKKRVSLAKVRAGTSGTDGTDGTDGADGVNAVEVVIAGAARTVPASAAGVVSNYAESGCEINVYEGTDTLGFITSTSSAALTPGTWQIYSATVSPSGDITVGPISDGGNEAIIGNHSGMDSATDTVTITYRVRAKRDNGSIVTRSIRQTISKARAGQDAAPGNPGTDGASVLVVYGSSGNEASNAQNLDPAGKNYVAYYEYTGAPPSLPIRTGISFVKYIGEDGAPSQGVWPIYADNAGGSGQSFSDVGKTHVTFYEATSEPSLPVSGQTFVKHIGDDGTDGSDGTDGQDGADGARGPGEYFIAVGSMSAANSSAEAHSLFTSAVGAPVVDDTATFHTGTAANPTDQITWRYTGASWTEIVKRFKGSVIIDDTLYVQAIVLDGTKFEGGPGDELTTKEKAFGEMQIKQDLTGTSIFAAGSWQNIESFTLQNDAEGDMFIELTCVVFATGTDGSDVTTNYLDYQLRLVVDPPGAGSVIALRSQRRLLPNGDAEMTISLPQADLSSRAAGTIDVDLEAKINARNPAGFNLGVRDITLKAIELKT